MLRCDNVYSYNRPFDGSHNVEVALSENEFDTPALNINISYSDLVCFLLNF